MAPEVLQQDKFGRRSDVWSVGGVILQMATTHPPWKCLNFKTPMALFYHVASTEGPPPLDAYDLSPLLKALLLRCFERDPRKRAHAEELADDPYLNVDDGADDSGELGASSRDPCDDTVARIESVATPLATGAASVLRPRCDDPPNPPGSASGRRDLSELRMRMSLRRTSSPRLPPRG